MTLYFKCPECGCIINTSNLQCPRCRHRNEWKVQSFTTPYLECDNCGQAVDFCCSNCGELIIPNKHQVFRGQESSASSGNTNGCFITEATCRSMGRADDCYELQSFRKFRDNWLKNESDGEKLIEEYYSIAPQIVEAINSKENSDKIYQDIWDTYLVFCLYDIESKNYSSCKERYICMVKALKDFYLS